MLRYSITRERKDDLFPQEAGQRETASGLGAVPEVAELGGGPSPHSLGCTPGTAPGTVNTRQVCSPIVLFPMAPVTSRRRLLGGPGLVRWGRSCAGARVWGHGKYVQCSRWLRDGEGCVSRKVGGS